MSDSVKKYLRWVLGVEGAPEFDPSDYDDVKTLMAAGISLFSVALDRYFPQNPPPSRRLLWSPGSGSSWSGPKN